MPGASSRARFDLSRSLPERSAATRAKAACAYAGALARGPDLTRAQILIIDALAEMPTDRAFVLDRVFCELRAGGVAREAGESLADIEHTRTAERLVASSGLGSDLLKLTVAMDVAEAYRMAGQHVEASAAFSAAYDRMVAMGRDRTEKAGTLLNNWGLARYLLGHPQEAERLFRRAVDIGSADAAGASVSPMLLTNLARPVLELGRVEEAIQIAERADAEAGRVGDNVVHVQSMLLLATAYREQGNLARAAELLAEFERAQRERGLPPGHVAYAALASEQALLAEARGDLGLAAAAADRAVAIAEASEQGRDVLARSLVRRAHLGVLRGQATAATADARRALALELEKAEPGSVTSVVGRANLALGAALAAAGETAGGERHAHRGAAPSRGVRRRGPRGYRTGAGAARGPPALLTRICRLWLAGTRKAHYNQWFQPTGRSFNGRTADSDSAYRGSNPCLPAKLFRGRGLSLNRTPVLGQTLQLSHHVVGQKISFASISRKHSAAVSPRWTVNHLLVWRKYARSNLPNPVSVIRVRRTTKSSWGRRLLARYRTER